MAYAQMDSPLPGLTVSPTGCHSCGMRGLGDDSTDFTDLPLTSVDPSEILTPTISPLDTGMISLPDTIGTEFISNGDGTYLNIQTGQSVPMDTAQQVTAATTGAATSGGVATTSAAITGTLVDPNAATSAITTNNLTTAAQALNAAGQLVTAAGKLTAQGQALLNAGNLYNAVPSTTPNLSTAMASLTSFFTGSTLIAGVPNIAVIGIGLAGLMALSSMGGKKKR